MLNKQRDNTQPWCIPFPIWNQSVVPCLILTVASWPAYRFLRRQVKWSSILITLRIFQFVVIHTVKGFGIVNEAELNIFLEFFCNLFLISSVSIRYMLFLSFILPGKAIKAILFYFTKNSVSAFLFGNSEQRHFGSTICNRSSSIHNGCHTVPCWYQIVCYDDQCFLQWKPSSIQWGLCTVHPTDTGTTPAPVIPPLSSDTCETF